MLAAADDAAGPLDDAGEAIFDPGYWQARGGLEPAARGRGNAWFIRQGGQEWVLRHYRRGGWLRHLLADRYCWSGERRVRAFAEWRLLEVLRARGLPVPQPIAARYRRRLLCYRCDLITRRIAGAQPLSALLAAAPLAQLQWQAIGAAVAHLHRAGADHADLNAHNILVDGAGAVSVIDFDRGRLRRPGAWTAGNLRRLRRSLVKLAAAQPAARFTAAHWHLLTAGYAAVYASPSPPDRGGSA